MTESFRPEGTIGAIAGGILLLTGHLINYLGGQPAGTTLGKASVFAGHIVLVFAFVGLYAYQQRRDSAPVGRAGMILSVIGTIIVSAVVFVELAGTTGVDTTPVFEAAGTTVLYTVGPLLFVIGMLTVGGSIIRREGTPHAIGGLLILGTVVFAAASVVADLAAVLTIVGAVLTAAGFVWLGAALYAADGSQPVGRRV